MNAPPPVPYGALVAGIDEAGRGCLAGPVYAAAVILGEEGGPIEGLDDSKKLAPARRERLYQQIVSRARAWAVARAEVAEIDRLNIERASHLAMQRAVQALGTRPSACWVDGNRAPDFGMPVRTIVGGDAIEHCIMAASILAKVARDRLMRELDALHPGYGLAVHKGYGTAAHREALVRLGPSAVHRMSFAPCRAAAAVSPGLAFARALPSV